MDTRWSSETARNSVNYGTTKAANRAVPHGLAKRLAGTGVTVSAILPGRTFTDGVEEVLKDAIAESGPSAREQADHFCPSRTAFVYYPARRASGRGR